MREGKVDKDALPVYESHPPKWLPKTHLSADLGHPGFHPPYPGQDEDILSEANVKNGYVVGHCVPAEHFSAQDTVNARFNQTDALTELEDLMNKIFTRRSESIPPIPPSSFRMPSRVTLNDAKRQAWFADLANPDVPLHKLGKNVPHGAKGHDLLDLLQTHNVAIPRAVWFLRVFGANETTGLRNKPSYNPTQYSVEWANLVTSYMKKQLNDIALPSAPRPGMNIKQTFKGVLSDADSRDRWISRFTYCLKLMQTFYSEGLVDHLTFLTWLVQQMGTCNLAQAGFLTRLADAYLDGILGSRPLARPFVDACLAKLSEIRTTSAQEYLTFTDALLVDLLQRVCLAFPDAFISPKMWLLHSDLLEQVLCLATGTELMDHSVEQIYPDPQDRAFKECFLDIKRRNEAMLFCNLPPRTVSHSGSSISDIQYLNTITNITDISTISFFPSNTISSSSLSQFASKLTTLLTWSVTALQHGIHRPFAAATLIRNWHVGTKEHCLSTVNGEYSSTTYFLQDQLFDWLDSAEEAAESGNIGAVALLFGEFVEYGLYDYSSYVQRLIARGEPGLSFAEDRGSRHRNFLRWIPLQHEAPASLLSQRKLTLHGARARTIPEELNEREMRKELRTALPELFGGSPQAAPLSAAKLLSSCPTLVSAPRFEQARTFKQWLLPIFKKHVNSQTAEATSQSMILKLYAVTVELMTHTRSFRCMLKMAIFLLRHLRTLEILSAIIDTVHRFATIWTCMDVVGEISRELFAVHQFWRSKGIQSRILLMLLLEENNNRNLDVISREQVAGDIAALKHALQPEKEHPDSVPPVLPEILLLADELNPEAPSILANSLWYKYRTAPDWAWKVWDNAVASIRQIPVMTSDVAGRHACALRYGSFLLHVDQHLPSGLDDQVLQWFLGPGRREVAALNADSWNVFTIVLLYLSVHGAITTTTILSGLVYPVWQHTAKASSGALGPPLEVTLRAANHLVNRLLFLEEGSSDGLPPSDLLDIQRIRTRNRDVYCEPHFAVLVAQVPTLLFIELNEEVSEDLRSDCKSVRNGLCRIPEFRQGVFRNLAAVREAFEAPLQHGEMSQRLDETLIDALKLVLWEPENNVEAPTLQEISSLLSPWKLAATAIHLQFTLGQMGRALSQDSTRHAASENLDKLTLKIFHHSMTSEQAYFVAEMIRGVDAQIAGKFINGGLQRIAEILDNAKDTSTSNPGTEWIRDAGEVLRVLIHVAEPLREQSALLPQLDAEEQDRFFAALCDLFESIVSIPVLDGVDADAEEKASTISRRAIFLARLLQFDLGFKGAWTIKTIEESKRLILAVFKLLVRYSSGSEVDPLAFSVLLDTEYYLIDEIPFDAKTIAPDLYRNYPDATPSYLPLDMPSGFKKQLNSLLPYVAKNSAVSNLVTAYRDSSGNLVYGAPVVNRPWEWIENLGEASVHDPKEEEKERADKKRLKTRYLVKNSGSLSLETFGARITGDGVIHNVITDDPSAEGNVRYFEDGLSAESIFKRDWRESRLDMGHEIPSTRNEDGVEVSNVTLTSTHGRGENRSTPRASPVPSARSRGSAHGSNSSLRPSPGQPALNRHSTSTSSDIIEVESASATSVVATKPKRKATLTDDDEIEIVEGPVPTSRAPKKVKVKAVTKSRVKRR